MGTDTDTAAGPGPEAAGHESPARSESPAESDSPTGAEPQLPAEPEYDPSAPAPLDVERQQTGNAEVDTHLARLGDADHLGTDDHLAVYEDVHRGLRDTLTALDSRPGPPAPGPPPHGHGR
ncbi:hypothetical protein HUT18_04425 [Streptomyces sp. NA04227]|uniref:hypothetical protein n=1 Tax=Streptomyces sp. NA04227 TaxID=2742136 RepID=UPI00158FD9AD|nr:hypothetical protein [Streptomyces sp. NA04227]QKW10644.1 hypothetical protein HUT18_04425 [Streptomyces sp. NA04227]